MIWIKILFPIIFMVGFAILPLERNIFDLSTMIRVAEHDDQHSLTAVKIDELQRYQPWRMELWERAGIEKFAAGNYGAAVHDLEHAGLPNLTINSQIVLADAYEKNGQLADASRMWAEIVMKQPDAGIFARLVDARRQSGSTDEVIAALRKWQQLEPFNPQVAYQLGLYLAVDQPDESLSQLSEAARGNPDYSSSVDTMQRAFALADLNADAGYRYTVIGRGLANLGQWDLAEKAFQKATLANPKYAEAWALLGEAHLQMGQDGSTELEIALKTNPNSVLARALMALYLGRGEKWDEAIEQLSAAARLEPERAVWHIELGNLNAQKGDLVKAKEEFQTAIDLEPRNAQTWYAMASFSYRYGVDLEQTGLEAVHKAIDLDEKDARSNDLLGAILVDLGQKIEGEKYLLRAIELNPGLAEAHLHLGNLYLQQQQMAGAFKQLVWAVRMDPNGVTGDLARRLLSRYFDASVESNAQP